MPQNNKADEFDEDSVVPLSVAEEGYQWGKPLYNGETIACFTEGVLYRTIETERNNRWSFYNDTLDAKINVQFTFSEGSKISALDNTTIEKLSDGSLRASVNIYPLETELFIEGTSNKYVSSIRIQSLSEEYLRDVALKNENTIKSETLALSKLCGRNASLSTLITTCLQQRVKFVDFFFPPEQISLQTGSQENIKTLPWERPSMFLSDANADQCRLFRNGVHPKNIEEGDLGDSWFTGAVAAVAEFPDKIRDIFRHPQSLEQGKKEREVGIYRVTLNKDGWWDNIVVDDFLPVIGGRPAFARTKGDPAEIWVSILQKAYAKSFGGYGFLLSGDPLHALQDISGFPCSSFDNLLLQGSVNEAWYLFNLLSDYCAKNYLIVLTTPTTKSIMSSRIAKQSATLEQVQSMYMNANLLLGHCYVVYKMGFFPETRTRMVQLRNVWARGPSNISTPWDKNDCRWSKHQNEANYFKIHEQDDNMFCMEWADVQNYFIGCGVCFLQSPMFDYRIRGCFLKTIPSCCLEIMVSKPTLMCIMLTQDAKQGTTKEEYSPIMLSVAHGDGDPLAMTVELNSSHATDSPTQEYTFVMNYSVSMFYEFLPEQSPYVVVPRAMSTYAQLPYVISLVSSFEIGDKTSEVSVAFRALAPDNRVFDNYQKFAYEAMPVETEFQVKRTDQFFPDIYVGTSIVTE